MRIIVIGSSSEGNGYVLQNGNGNQLLLEAGMHKKSMRATGIKRIRFDGCLVSHAHRDHSKKAYGLLMSGTEVYMSQDTARILGLDHYRLHIIEEEVQFNIGPWKVLPFSTVHDSPGSLGFIIRSSTGETICFATDTAWIKYRPRGLTHIMVECNYQEQLLIDNLERGKVSTMQGGRIKTSHLSLETLLRWLGTLDLSCVKEIMLLHLSRVNAVEEELVKAVHDATGKRVVIARGVWNERLAVQRERRKELEEADILEGEPEWLKEGS
jgi:phosphoribosyl 1,2-cyclic phosphodiesterase